ncbi:thioredoxin family protein [Croceitalea sp. MTPC5]|uniref:TlpA family protein disulfide reductase n=1 Tax=Croceitalea sp. MTPC5 TaxID=3056565 RepID=UPI002B3B6068|nr:thioredoxin family protein [Croceitalea sp. MTPC5]
MRLLLLILSGSVFLACTGKKASSDTVYFGGEIVNPSSEYVVLYKNDVILDSAKLDQNNRFAFSLKNIDEGLHHFDHLPEQQYVYLERGDSILIRLNTMAFDESLVFSGSNEEVNNFMIEMFLNYEDEERLVYAYYQLSPEDFSSKIDSLRGQKLAELEEFIVGEDLSEEAYSMAKATIDYNSFLYKEKYPFYHRKKTNEDTFHQLKGDFYGYRKNLDFNNLDLAYFKPYYDFMIHHFGNISYMNCVENCNSSKYLSKKNQLHLNRHKMTLIDSLVDVKELRDNLFRNVAMDYLLKVHETNKDCHAFIQEFESLSENDIHKEEIRGLYHSINNLQADKELPDLKLEDIDGNMISLKEMSKSNNTLFYFWTASQKRHFKNVLRHIDKISKKHPDFKFVGINLRTGRKQWENLIRENKLDTTNQYWSDNFNTVQAMLVIDNLNKCIISEDTVIVDGFANVFKSF